MQGYIYGINGPVIKVSGNKNLKLHEMVSIGDKNLIGEVIEIKNDYAIVEVYEPTTGLKVGDKVKGQNMPLSASLGPGIIGNIFDGIQRPLDEIKLQSGAFITQGVEVRNLNTQKIWDVEILAKVGDRVEGGSIVAKTRESGAIIHKIMIPPNIFGQVIKVCESGGYKVNDTIMQVKGDKGEVFDITLMQKWPIRIPRPIKKREEINMPLVTGQRVIDTLFPIAKGGTAAIPGGFGTGKTMTQHQLAKWSDADIIVYIGCGERGNEMTQVLEDFKKLVDPRTKKNLLERTILIANTSNMPVAAREASIYTGITIAEYYRDMGYHVAIMADSTSRWAEALREISGRLEEMPAEEGFPAYLSSRLSAFYERAAYVENLNNTKGSVTIIGAVSPQGGDFSEPVTQNTKRYVRTFWALDRNLAYSRHYPAIQWMTSYSEYIDDLEDWYKENVSDDFVKMRSEFMNILYEESSLMEIVKLIGSDVLPEDQKLILEISKVIRVGFVQQNAFHEVDTYVPLLKQRKMMEVILYLYEKSKKLTDLGIPISILKKEGLFEKVTLMKFDIKNDELHVFDDYIKEIDEFYEKMLNTQF